MSSHKQAGTTPSNAGNLIGNNVIFQNGCNMTFFGNFSKNTLQCSGFCIDD